MSFSTPLNYRNDANWRKRVTTIFRKAFELSRDFPSTEAMVIVNTSALSDTFQSSPHEFEWLHSQLVCL
jgi:hypothetical protein